MRFLRGGLYMFGAFGAAEEAIFEIYIEDKLVNKQSMQAPSQILMMNFTQMVNQIGNDKRPMKIKLIKPEIIWDRFENKEKTLNNESEFSNNAMLAWQEEKQENKQEENVQEAKNESIKE